MRKKDIVRLSDAERASREGVVKRLNGSSQKVRRAQILLKADADGPAGTDAAIVEAYGCRRRTVESLRERFVSGGFDSTLEGRPRAFRAKLLDGVQEATILALRLGTPPAGFANWSLRLLAERVVTLEIAPAIRRETVRRTLKKRA